MRDLNATNHPTAPNEPAGAAEAEGREAEGREAEGREAEGEEGIDQASMDSFPSSDAPSWSTGRDASRTALKARLPSISPVRLAQVQGSYFLLSGLWPLLHIRSFEAATGGKKRNERWLLKTVGALSAGVGAALLESVRDGHRPERGIRRLGSTTALGFLAIDVYYVATKKISPVYLLDAAAEALFALGWSRARP